MLNSEIGLASNPMFTLSCIYDLQKFVGSEHVTKHYMLGTISMSLELNKGKQHKQHNYNTV